MSFNPRPPGAQGTEGEFAAELQYGQDPRAAMVNAILNMGGNPFVSSPFMKMLLRTAPGLQMVHALSNIGAKPNDIGAMGGKDAMFGEFLKSQIGSGKVNSSLRGAATQLPNYVDQLRQYQNASGSMPIDQVSPFAEMLEEMLGSPEGIGRIMTSLIAPGLGSLGQPWAQGLGDVLQSTENRYANEFAAGRAGSLEKPDPFFDYVFGPKARR